MSAVTSIKRRDADATREKLLDAALHCFSTQGFEASSTRQIEEVAGVKRGLISYHFGSKQSLWEAMARRTMAIARDELVGADNAENVHASSRLRRLVRAYVHFAARHPEVNRLMIHEGMLDDWRLQWLVKHSVRPWFDRVASVLDDARANGIALPIENHNFFYILVGAASVIFTNAEEARLLTGRNTLSESEVNAHADALTQLLFPKDLA